MLLLEDLDRLMAECVLAWHQLRESERQTLRRLAAERKRLGADMLKELSYDDLEMLEDCAARCSAATSGATLRTDARGSRFADTSPPIRVTLRRGGPSFSSG